MNHCMKSRYIDYFSLKQLILANINKIISDLTCNRKMVEAYEDPLEPQDAHNDGNYHHFASSLDNIFITILCQNTAIV